MPNDILAPFQSLAQFIDLMVKGVALVTLVIFIGLAVARDHHERRFRRPVSPNVALSRWLDAVGKIDNPTYNQVLDEVCRRRPQRPWRKPGRAVHRRREGGIDASLRLLGQLGVIADFDFDRLGHLRDADGATK